MSATLSKYSLLSGLNSWSGLTAFSSTDAHSAPHLFAFNKSLQKNADFLLNEESH